MSFISEYKDIKSKYKNHILIIQRGNFYIAINDDAKVIHDILGFKLRIQKTGDYEVGFPVSSMEKNKQALNNDKYRLVIYKELDKFDEKTGVKVRQLACIDEILKNDNKISEYVKQNIGEEIILEDVVKNLVSKIFKITENSPKKYRYSLVAKSVEIVLDILEGLYYNKYKEIEIKIKILEHLLVLLKENNAITNKQLESTAYIIQKIRKSI